MAVNVAKSYYAMLRRQKEIEDEIINASPVSDGQPFTTRLISSQPRLFRYCWYWYKNMPIKNRGKHPPAHRDSVYRMDGSLSHDTATCITHYPRQLLEIKCERGLHPTQKPVALFEYLIRTYTNPGELVLDNCMGSGTTAVACIRSGRKFTGFEMDPEYYQTATERIRKFC